jgi:tRNA (mo5U34)-methyltransferase
LGSTSSTTASIRLTSSSALGAGDEVEFRKHDVNELDGLGESFQVSFCFGLIYHLENPISTMRKLAEKTEEVLFIDGRIEPIEGPYWQMNFIEARPRTSTSLYVTEKLCQLRPTRLAVEELLDFLGFAEVTTLERTRPFLRGQWASFVAKR